LISFCWKTWFVMVCQAYSSKAPDGRVRIFSAIPDFRIL
jgi:hypothetical protein